ncbi:Iron-regulated transcriptional activator AFT1 [Wickerhamomyces ciferrii]|uniref:Iron-regulated transcriptional activator AFT1 n=1 Tax=Wickerhamomyces ciferrii (strain ATCC 14091 / BCRC 22168 / CBS 111 / JCM 3599 / NBRC 0793 / NRRL Y-1031 F-60-10) TaxID=1206466 RepID=K0KQJ9_WICCF|nr:Iron-regulated transcriptional activator AFT1 [Wickerhamomyces ciferrii]CCH44427.1 Iron-regulated transcriptional activator AFT1 [Wickerhamomyces ciferrii]
MSYNSDKITTNEEILEALNPVPNFKNRDDIKPWIHENLDSRGINLVIERSDASKVVFKCKNLYRKSSTPRSTTTKIINGKQVVKRVRRSIPEDSCPFRLRVSYSVKYKNWSVNIIKHEHNLSLCSNFGQGQPSPIDHAAVNNARQYGNQSVRPMLSNNSSYYSTSGSIHTGGSSSNAPSPLSSSYTASPAFTTTPYSNSGTPITSTSHDLLADYEIPTTFRRSQLYNEIDPLDQISNSNTGTSSSTNHDLSSLHDELNFVYSNNHSDNEAFAKNLDEFQDLLNDQTPKQQQQHEPRIGGSSSHQLSQQQLPSPSPPTTDHITSQFQLFDDSPFNKFYEHPSHQPIQPKPQTHQQVSNTSSPSQNSPFSPSQQNNNSLNIKQEDAQENDPLMYLLSSTNQSYTFEELESLDKAMGIDANDKILMSMFQGI